MYTIYNTGDIIWWKPDGSVASVWTSDGLYFGEDGLIKSNWLTKTIVHAVRYVTIGFHHLVN